MRIFREAFKTTVCGLALAGCQATTDSATYTQADHIHLAAPDSCPPEGEIVQSASPYATSLIQKIQKKPFYPQEAIHAGIEGNLVLCVQLNRSGEVIEALVAQTAGHPILDGAALYSIGIAQVRHENFGAMPDDFEPQKTMVWIAVSVYYHIIDQAPVQKLAIPACITAPSQHFYNSVMEKIQENIFYPPATIRANQEGSAVVSMTVDDNDGWSNAKIIKSAGNPLFDGAALLSIGYFFLSDKRPCVTTEMKDHGHEFTIQMPINWELH